MILTHCCCLVTPAFAPIFVLEDFVNEISTYFNYNGGFHNITVPSGVILRNFCFGGQSALPDSDFYLKTVTFEGESPATIGTKVFAPQNINNGLKIYVPDNSLEAYKNVSNLSLYVDCIFPVSQKE